MAEEPAAAAFGIALVLVVALGDGVELVAKLFATAAVLLCLAVRGEGVSGRSIVSVAYLSASTSRFHCPLLFIAASATFLSSASSIAVAISLERSGFQNGISKSDSLLVSDAEPVAVILAAATVPRLMSESAGIWCSPSS